MTMFPDAESRLSHELEKRQQERVRADSGPNCIPSWWQGPSTGSRPTKADRPGRNRPDQGILPLLQVRADSRFSRLSTANLWIHHEPGEALMRAVRRATHGGQSRYTGSVSIRGEKPASCCAAGSPLSSEPIRFWTVFASGLLSTESGRNGCGRTDVAVLPGVPGS